MKWFIRIVSYASKSFDKRVKRDYRLYKMSPITLYDNFQRPVMYSLQTFSLYTIFFKIPFVVAYINQRYVTTMLPTDDNCNHL